MFLRKVFSFLSIGLLFLCEALASANLRTSLESDGYIFIAVDFKVKNGEHITAPVGKGKSVAPNVIWENAEIADIFWPDSIVLPNSDGSPSGYYGYDKDFSIIYKLKIIDGNAPVNYALSYVVCSDACIPCHEKGILKTNGLLSEDEIKNVSWEANNRSNSCEAPNFLLALLFGLLGGIILNFMPCVFPIISMKIFSIVKIAKSSKKNIRKHGISFSSGILGVFLSLGIIVILLRQSIGGIGWGFYMQSPTFVFALLLAFLFCGFHFLGIFKVRIPEIRGIKLPVRNEYLSSFFSGAFGGLASSSCVGPFSGAAIASALLYDNLFQSIGIFIALGIGMSFPFLLISIWPNLAKRVPKPGKRLLLFEEFMGFAMLFSCVWPIWILLSQVSASRLVVLLLCCVSIAMFLQMLKHAEDSRIFKYFTIAGALISAAAGAYTTISVPNPCDRIAWVNYSDEAFDDAKIAKTAIFLDFTASWCANCQFNERLFSDEDVIYEFKKKNVKAIKCDWTNRNEKVTNLLKEYGAAAVPFYVFYPGNGNGNGKGFTVLPTILTKKVLLDALARGEDY
ncbi:MAG: thioredoxin family protein [Holosporales bacterium]|jgi:thiol:disulfide interchange protein DsbD|nr:thioredoxin family protein [Holosporales bacterium]